METKEQALSIPIRTYKSQGKRMIRDVQCPTCGKMFSTKDRKKRFCALECYVKSPEFKIRLLENSKKGNKSRSEKAGNDKIHTEYTCLQCGKIYIEKTSRNKKFCNQTCYRKYMADRFDRWIASPQTIALPQNYDEFLTSEILPCLVEGCGWKGDHLSLHMNQAHGVKAKEFKKMAGFNMSSGIISLPLHETLVIQNENKAPIPPKYNPTVERHLYRSLESKEHQKKATSIIIGIPSGKFINCKECGKEFEQSTIFGKTLFCSIKCRNRNKYNKNKKYSMKCTVCGKEFTGDVRQKNRIEKGEAVACSIVCRQRHNGSLNRGSRLILN